MGYREVPEREADHKGRIGNTARYLGTMVSRYGKTKGRRVQILPTCDVIIIIFPRHCSKTKSAPWPFLASRLNSTVNHPQNNSSP